MARTDSLSTTPPHVPVAFVGPERMFQSIFPPQVLREFRKLNGVSILPPTRPAAQGAVLAVTGWGSPRFDAELLDEMPTLRGIVHAAGSVRSVISDDIWRRGIEICNNANLNAKPVAEYTFAMIVAAAKGVLPRLDRPALGLYDVSIGIVGASRIGRATIRLLSALDVSVLLYDPFIGDEEAARLGVQRVDLDTLLQTSDIVSLHVPSLEATRHLIGSAELAQMKHGSTLINTARGAVVDTSALVQVLKAGGIQAILDVTDPEPLPEEHPLRHLPNVTITDHIAGSMGRELWRLGRGVIHSTEEFIRTGHLPHRITPALLQVQA